MNRIENKELLAEYAKKPCCVFGATCGGPVAGHHIKTKGAGGHDEDSNLIPLCVKHHLVFYDGIHPLGVTEFMKKYIGAIDDESWAKLSAWVAFRGLV